MSYSSHTKEDIAAMLSAIGAKDIDELFRDIPPALRARSFDLPEGRSEYEVTRYLKHLAAKNATSGCRYCVRWR